jgi:hypothetical protein
MSLAKVIGSDRFCACAGAAANVASSAIEDAQITRRDVSLIDVLQQA